jgi:hypothetical protein
LTRILNFTVPKLKPLLLNGQKTQTIRGKQYWIDLIKKKKLNVGDLLQIYFNQRSSSGEKLFDARVTHLKIIVALKWEPALLFLRDGFSSKQEGLDWFEKTYKTLNQEFSLIGFLNVKDWKQGLEKWIK